MQLQFVSSKSVAKGNTSVLTGRKDAINDRAEDDNVTPGGRAPNMLDVANGVWVRPQGGSHKIRMKSEIRTTLNCTAQESRRRMANLKLDYVTRDFSK